MFSKVTVKEYFKMYEWKWPEGGSMPGRLQFFSNSLFETGFEVNCLRRLPELLPLSPDWQYTPPPRPVGLVIYTLFALAPPSGTSGGIRHRGGHESQALPSSEYM